MCTAGVIPPPPPTHPSSPPPSPPSQPTSMGVLSILRPRRASDEASSSSSSPKHRADDLQPVSRSTPTSPTINYNFFDGGAASSTPSAASDSSATSMSVSPLETTAAAAAQPVQPKVGILVRPSVYRPASAEATMTAHGNERSMNMHSRSISYSTTSSSNAYGTTRVRRLPSTAPSEGGSREVATILQPAATGTKPRGATKHVAYATNVEGSVVRKRPAQPRAPLTPASAHSYDGGLLSPAWDAMLSVPMNKTPTLPGNASITIAAPSPEYSRVYYSSTASPSPASKSSGKRFGLRTILAK